MPTGQGQGHGRRYLEELFGAWTLLGVLGQSELDETVKVGRPLVLVLESRWLEATLGHDEERPHGMQIEVGRLELGKLDGCYADGPDVTLLVVAALSLDSGHFGSLSNSRGQWVSVALQNDVHKTLPSSKAFQ